MFDDWGKKIKEKFDDLKRKREKKEEVTGKDLSEVFAEAENFAEKGEILEIPPAKYTANYMFSFRQNMINSITIYFYFAIYAAIDVILNPPSVLADRIVYILSYPIFLEFLFSFRSIEKYTKAILKTVFILLLIIFPLLNVGVITYNGIIFLKDFIAVFRFLFSLYGISSGSEGPALYIVETLLVVQAIAMLEAVLLVIFVLVRPRTFVEMFATDRAVYIRTKAKGFGLIEIGRLLKNILFQPFNVYRYVQSYKKFVAARKAIKEEKKGKTHKYFYGRIPYGAIRKLEKGGNIFTKEFIYSIILVIIGFFMIPLLGTALLLLFINFIYEIIYRGIVRLGKRRVNLKIEFDRHEVSGALKYAREEDVILLYGVERKYAEKIDKYFNDISGKGAI